MTSREFQDVIEMTKSANWRVFVDFVTKKASEYGEAAMQPIDRTEDVYACERAKGACIVLKSLTDEFRSQMVEKMNLQLEQENAKSA